jgi:alpha-L-fucosidase
LLDIYYHSVGRNASFLLNFPVDTRGLIHENDVEAVLKLAEALKADFAVDLAKGQKITATNVRGNSNKFGTKNLTDEKTDTYWATDDDVTEASLTLEFAQPTTFNRLLLQEYIPLGQRVKKFKVESLQDGNWQTLAEETTIGYKRILRLPDVNTRRLRVTIEDSKAAPVLSNLQVFNAPKVLESPVVSRNQAGEVTITAADKNVEIFYTIDGTAPDATSLKYDAPFMFAQKGILSAVPVDPQTGNAGPAARQEFDIPAANWQLLGEPGKNPRANAMFDGNPNTTLTINQALPVDFIIDLNETVNLAGFNYLPDQSRYSQGIIRHYELSVSADGRNFGRPVASGEFGNIANSPIGQRVTFAAVPARFIRFRAVSEATGQNRAGIAEFSVITE